MTERSSPTLFHSAVWWWVASNLAVHWSGRTRLRKFAISMIWGASLPTMMRFRERNLGKGETSMGMIPNGMSKGRPKISSRGATGDSEERTDKWRADQGANATVNDWMYPPNTFQLDAYPPTTLA